MPELEEDDDNISPFNVPFFWILVSKSGEKCAMRVHLRATPI